MCLAVYMIQENYSSLCLETWKNIKKDNKERTKLDFKVKLLIKIKMILTFYVYQKAIHIIYW